jgi:hypothetical protein
VTGRRIVPWAIVLAAALVYPLATLAGGAPRLPSRAECVHPAHADGELEVVFGRFERASDADAMLETVLRDGFQGSQIEPDGCGLLKVAVHGISTLKVGEEVMAEARSVHLEPTLEEVTR